MPTKMFRWRVSTLERGLKKVSYVAAVLLLLLSNIRYVRGESSVSVTSPSDYGIYAEMNEILTEIEEKRNHTSPEINRASEQRLNGLSPVTHDPPNIPFDDLETVEVLPLDPKERTPTLYGDMGRYEELHGKDSLLDFVLDRGFSNYYIYTRYQGYYRFTKDYLRRIWLPPRDLQGGAEIDIDNDSSTGNARGNEVFIALQPKVVIKKMPSLIPFDQTVRLRLGLELMFEQLEPVRHPLSFQVIKYISYENKNYLFNVGADLKEVPSRLTMDIYSENITVDLAPGQMIWSFVNNYLLNRSVVIENGSLMSSMSGPYHFTYYLSEEDGVHIRNVSFAIGMCEVRNGSREGISWAGVTLSAAEGEDHVPPSGNITLDSASLIAAVDKLEWECRDSEGEPMTSDISVRYYDEGEKLTYALIEAVGVPGWLSISIDYAKTVNGRNVTPFKYRAEGPVESLTYRAYQYLEYPSLERFKCVGISFDHIPPSFDIEVTSDINRQIPRYYNVNMSLPVPTRLIDNLIRHLVVRFTRIGRTLHEMSETMTRLSGTGGWMRMKANDGGHFGRWEFHKTSDIYLRSERTADHISFLERPTGGSSAPESPVPEETAISGRLTGFDRLELNFSHYTELNVSFSARKLSDPLRMILVRGSRNLFLEFTDLPEEFRLKARKNGLDVSLDGKRGISDSIGKMEIIFEYEERYMYVLLTDISRRVRYEEREGALKISSPVPLGDLRYYFTNNTRHPLRGMEGDYVLLDQKRESISFSGHFHSLKHIEYKPGAGGYLHLVHENETEFAANMYNYLGGGSEMRMIIDPLPSDLTFELPGAVGSVERFPSVVNVTGNLNLTTLVEEMTSVVNDMVDLTFEVSKAFLENIGDLSRQFNFSYLLEEDETMDITAYFRKGDISRLRETHWVHGVSVAQAESGGTLSMEGKVYLQGMPERGTIFTNMSGDDTLARLAFERWRPQNRWLLLESYGIQKRDVVVYVNGLKSNIDFNMDVDLHSNMSIGGRIQGDITINTTSNPGQFYVSFIKYGRATSSTTILLSSIPKDLRVSFGLYEELYFDYKSSSPIKYIYLANSRLIREKWYHTHGLFHDVADRIDFRMTPAEYDPARPAAMQSLPSINLLAKGNNGSSEGELDLYFKVDGRTLGQVANFEFTLQDVEVLSMAPLGRDGFSLISPGIGFFSVRAENLPLMEHFSVDRILVTGVDVDRATIEMDMIFGVYPTFEFRDVSAKIFQINIEARTGILGDYELDISLMNIATDPTSFDVTLYSNKVCGTGDGKGRRIIPAPMLTLWNSVLRGG